MTDLFLPIAACGSLLIIFLLTGRLIGWAIGLREIRTHSETISKQIKVLLIQNEQQCAQIDELIQLLTQSAITHNQDNLQAPASK